MGVTIVRMVTIYMCTPHYKTIQLIWFYFYDRKMCLSFLNWWLVVAGFGPNVNGPGPTF